MKIKSCSMVHLLDTPIIYARDLVEFAFEPLMKDQFKTVGFTGFLKEEGIGEDQQIAIERYLIFDVKQQVKKVDNKLLKERVLAAYKQHKLEHSGVLSRADKLHIKERIFVELVRDTLPKSDRHSVIINTEIDTFVVNSTSDAVWEDIEGLLENCIPDTVKFAKSQIGIIPPLENLGPDQEHIWTLSGLQLGREFLTWLLFVLDTSDTSDGLNYGDKISLISIISKKEQVAVLTKSRDLKEVKAGLRNGKWVNKLALTLTVDVDSHSNNEDDEENESGDHVDFIIDDTLNRLKSIKIKSSFSTEEEEEDPEVSELLDQMFFINMIFDKLSDRYIQFAQIRCNDNKWHNILAQMDEWKRGL